RRGKREDVLDPRLEIFEVERGGEATYHGPGQLVGYPILKLPDRLEVKRLVTDLEEVLLRTCADFGIDATREGPERGVWVGGKKIASIGLAVHRNVTFHGFAHNVTTDLREFLKIRPCGHDGGIMTSMEKCLGHPVDLEDVKASVIVHFQAVFGVTFRRVNLIELLPEPSSGRRPPCARPRRLRREGPPGPGASQRASGPRGRSRRSRRPRLPPDGGRPLL